jgi:arsenate reductase-like glutaredoxin family protein
MIVHGLRTCDTTRAAVKALSGKGAVLRDVREDPPDAATLRSWLDRLGPALVNRASTTWRGLTGPERELPETELLARHPALMKRPVIEDGDRLTLGWSRDVQSLWS